MSRTQELSDRFRSYFWPFVSLSVSREVRSEVEELQGKVDRGDIRFRSSPVRLSLAWFPPHKDPDYTEQLSSNHGIGEGEDDLQDEFFEELSALIDFVEEPPDGIPLEKWQQSSVDGARRMWSGLNKRAYALSVWDNYAVPLRVRDETVYRVWAPADVLGTPIIKGLPVEQFVVEVAEQTARDRYRIGQLQAQVTIFKTALVAALLIAWMAA